MDTAGVQESECVRGGSLLVGNHTIYGFLDLPFMIAEIWKRRQIMVRGLGEHGLHRARRPCLLTGAARFRCCGRGSRRSAPVEELGELAVEALGLPPASGGLSRGDAST
jgi:hypothetical protein